MADPICFLDIVEPEDADGLLAETCEEIRHSDGSVHNLYRTMSLRPEPTRRADARHPRETWFPTPSRRSDVDMRRESESAALKDRRDDAPGSAS